VAKEKRPKRNPPNRKRRDKETEKRAHKRQARQAHKKKTYKSSCSERDGNGEGTIIKHTNKEKSRIRGGD